MSILFRIKSILGGLILLFVFAAPVSLQAAETDPPHIVVNLPGRTITLYAGDAPLKEYPVAIGKTSTPTPLGNFSVVSKEINPSWYPPERPGQVVPPGPGNPLGHRWLGFIANNYGIHGTNDPDSIGRIVTNGCIRMRNSDVEELFELVSYNTPVKITYDLTKASTDKSGQVKISIYPDVYGRGKPTVASVRNLLEAYGLSAFADDNYLAEILAESSAKPVDIIKTIEIRINGEPLAGQGIVTQGNTYIPLKTATDILAAKFPVGTETKPSEAGTRTNPDGNRAGSAESGADGNRQQTDSLLVGDRKIPVFTFNNIAYVSGGDIEKLLGGRQSWQDNDTCWSFDKTVIFCNGKKTGLGTIIINNILAIPLKDLAAALNRTGRWDETSQTFFLETAATTAPVQIKPDMIGSEPFLVITKINEYFDTFVYWNIQNNTIELTS